MKPIDLKSLGLKGCGDNSCHFESPTGMATNGGCRCRPNTWHLATHKIQKHYLAQIAELEESNKQLVKLCSGQVFNIAELEAKLEQAKERIRDMLKADDGQAYSEAEVWLELEGEDGTE